MKISVLHSNEMSPNEIAFLYPLYRYRQYLKNEYDFNINFTKDINNTHADIVLISSKYFSKYWRMAGIEKIRQMIVFMKKQAGKIFWCDISDSTGTTHFMVLPYVDKYIKNQVLKDRMMYLKSFYGARIYTNYMHQHFGITDSGECEAHLNYIPDKECLKKIYCGWNSGIAYYGSKRHIQNELFKMFPYSVYLFKNNWISPLNNRKTRVSCRIGVTYNRETISESRLMIRKHLKEYVQTDKILSHRRYIAEMRNSKIVLSPFGLGEISLRDFEATINGASIIKQDMSHIETWPNLWIKGETYLPFKWDMSDLKDVVSYACLNEKEMMGYAITAQEIYRNAFEKKNIQSSFLGHFLNLMS